MALVSSRVDYRWRCGGCNGIQEVPIWRILDSRERGDVIEQLGAGLSWVFCPKCGTVVDIDAPLLLIRPQDPLPLLLAVPISELGGPPLAPPSGAALGQEARAALENTAGITGPMIPLPRILLPVVLARDASTDAADPDRAAQEVFGEELSLVGSWYRSFLDIVRSSAPERRLMRTFDELWRVPPQELEDFLRDHLELRTTDAVSVATAQLAALPDEQNDDPVLTQFRTIMRARLHLVEGLVRSDHIPSLVTDYLAALERGAASVNARLAQLLNAVRAQPGIAGVPQLREALDMAVGLHDENLEAVLSADLGARLLSQPIKDNATIEECIRLLERALSLLPEGHARWAQVASNLGSAYQQRVSGDAFENWDTARSLIQRACDAIDRAADTRSWAVYQTNYGFLLSERPGGSTAEDLDRAIDYVRSGLEERSPERNVIDWAYSLINLGMLHRRRGAVGDEVTARDCYERALAHLAPDDDLQLWVRLQNNLADLFLSVKPPDLAKAEAAVGAALAEIDITADPLVAGRLTWQLARVEDHRTGPLSPKPVRLRHDALNLLGPGLAPSWHLRIGGELVDAYAQLDNWAAAADVYTSMLAAFDNLYDVQISPAGRRAMLSAHPRLGRWAAYAFARVGRLEDAVEAIEHSRARELSVAVSRDTADLARLAATDEHLARRYRSALAGYRAALHATDPALPGDGAGAEISAAERSVRDIVSEIRNIPGYAHFLRPMTLVEISIAGNGRPVIYLVNAPRGSYVLTVQADRKGGHTVKSISVPEVTSTDIAHLVLFGKNGEPGLISAQSAHPWPGRLRVALQRLAEIEPLLRPVADILAADPQHVAVIIPTGLLGLIPLPAAEVAGQFLDNVGELHLAPSAGVYAACRARTSQERLQHFVGVANPDGTLSGSEAELAAIRELFEASSQASTAVGADATRAWVLANVSSASHLHFACHGASTISSTVGGVLRLAGENVLTVEDLLDGRLNNCRLAVASACQSGHYATADTPDEFTGLPAGFLQAGAACAVASLWQVRDDITSLFMTRFYELLEPNRNNPQQQWPVSALREARTWLRNLDAKQVESFTQSHPHLPKQVGRSIASYSLPENWAAFAAWGC
jgi:tetratricopeptide (TPR) repeat protein